MTKMNWDWIAGFYEGEGNINWIQGRKGTKQGTSGRVVIGQKNKQPLEAIREFLEAEGFSRCLLYQRKAVEGYSAGIWILGINYREEVIRFLDMIAPMLYQQQKKVTDISNRLKALKKLREVTLDKALSLRQSGKCWRDISRELHVNPNTIYNYARLQGIEIRQNRPLDKISWRKDRVRQGLCGDCGKTRGEKGTKNFCRECADINNARSKEWKRKQRRQKQLLSAM